MLAPVLLLGVLLPGGKADNTPQVFKGAALYRTCQSEVRLMNLPSLAKAARKDLIDGTYCVGFLNGYLGNLKAEDASICTDGASMGSVVRAYVAFMDANTQFLEEDRRIGVKLALHQAFPCPAGKSTAPEFAPGVRPRTL